MSTSPEAVPVADELYQEAGGGTIRSSCWVIAKASLGEYDPSCLRREERLIGAPAKGEVIVKTMLMSLDPTTRNWLTLKPELMFIPLAVGDVMVGSGLGTVVASADPGFAVGDLVTGMWGWEEYSKVTGTWLEKHSAASLIPATAYLSLFSHVGRAAAIGILEVAQTRPADTVVVSGAAGATGSIAVQLAKRLGCKVIAIAGGQEKCTYTVDKLKADFAIDYKSEDVCVRLAELCPSGVNVYFDNVGGPVLDAVLVNMAVGCRIALCGAMSQYNLASPEQVHGIKNLPMLLFKRAKIEGYVVPDFAAVMQRFDDALRDLYSEGTLELREHVLKGLDSAPEGVRLLFSGENQGKLIVRI
ncbi:NADPH-dependent curcumin reductase CurA [Arthrobacter bambusae]|uniref:NADPH-dependent curcumin reductase CurA n=1 Tax=Arthrobacter bambusae TaxID=1338426 RepID=A0ABV2P1X5_9MICC